jgi:uncharacterized protein
MSISSITVEIVEAHATNTLRERIELQRGANVADALGVSSFERAHALLKQMQSIEHVADSDVGVWGRRVLLHTALVDGDRIELYRTVIADAKAARTRRANEQGYRWQGRTRRAAKSSNN